MYQQLVLALAIAPRLSQYFRRFLVQPVNPIKSTTYGIPAFSCYIFLYKSIGYGLAP